MKKILPCSFKTKLLSLMFFVAFFVTNLSAQVCLNSTTTPGQFVCPGDNLLWTTTSFNSSAGLAITWTLTDGTGGASFVATGTNVYHTVVNPGTPNINSALVHMGPNAGSVTVQMQFDINPNPNTCSSSGVVKTLSVSGTPSIQKCAQDTGCINATGLTDFGFPIGKVNTNNYTFTLNPGGATNTTGTFCGLAPGPYTVSITDDTGCHATSATINLVNPPVVPVHATCPGSVSVNSCFYVDDAAANAAYIAWLNGVGFSGGTGTVTPTLTITPPNPVISACGTNVHITYSVIDECGQTDSCSADFVITPYVPVVTAQPLDRDIPYCQIKNLNLADEFANFLKAFRIVSGGCAPTLTPVAHGDPSSCGGEPIVVTFILHDKCAVDKPLTAIFTVHRPLEPHIDARPDVNLPACVSQGDLDTAWNSFLGSVTASDECGPLPVDHGNPIKPDKCIGGDVLVKFIANPNCFPPLEVDAHFIVAPAPKPRITLCPPATDLKCNPVLPPAVVLPTVDSTCKFTIDVNDGPVTGDTCLKQMVRTFKVSTECWPNADSCTQLFTWSTDTGIRNVVCPPGQDLGCNPPGLPAVVNPTYESDCPADVTHEDLPATGPDCAREQIRRFLIKTACHPEGVPCDQLFKFKVDKVVPVITRTGICPTDIVCNPSQTKIDELLGAATATDNCDGDITSKLDVVTTPAQNTHDCFYTQTRIWNVKDKCDNPAVEVRCTIIYKIDNEGPVLNGLVDITIPGGDEDSGLCSPTTTVGGKSIPIPVLKTSSGVAVDFGQVRTGDAPDEVLTWTNGTTTAQSEYLEGQGVPQRILLQGLKKGKHTFYIKHEAVKKQDAARHGYDFFMSWDQAIQTTANIGTSGRVLLKNLNNQECDGKWSGAGQSICQGMTTSAKTDIPDIMGNPPDQTGITNVDDAIKCFEGEYGNRQVELEGTATISGAKMTFLGYTGNEDKSNYAWYTIEWTSDSPNIEIKLAGRMAMGGGSCGYGNCHGAGSIKGNPYHIILAGLDGDNLGNRDNQTKCKRSQTCDVNIPVKFPPVTATDCDPAHPIVTVGPERIQTLPNGDVQHCQDYSATDQCGNPTTGTSCITVQCVLGANFGDQKGLIKLVGVTGKSIQNSPSDIAGITKFTAYPNPFRSSFTVDVNSNNPEQMLLNVYDMLGKSIDQRYIRSNEFSTGINLGSEYPTGIYNIMLNQATEVKTLRIIKQ